MSCRVCQPSRSAKSTNFCLIDGSAKPPETHVKTGSPGAYHFWAGGCFVSTVGLDESMVRAYIRNQEEEDERYDQMKLTMG